MAEKDTRDQRSETTGEELDAEASGADAAETDPYEGELKRYQATLDSDMAEAMGRYGFSLYHSLPPLKQVELGQKLGFPVESALDHYNSGCLAASQGDLKGAVQQFKKALSLDEEYHDALFNLALCQEKLGHKAEAAELWKRYVDTVENEEEKEAVQAHIAAPSA